jgi:hypothetical protein
MYRAAMFSRYYYDFDGFETSEVIWETASGSYLLERHASNPKSGPYDFDMTPEKLRLWLMERPEGVTTRYDPNTQLPLNA